jgi:acyl-CoA thioesterase I
MGRGALAPCPPSLFRRCGGHAIGCAFARPVDFAHPTTAVTGYTALSTFSTFTPPPSTVWLAPFDIDIRKTRIYLEWTLRVNVDEGRSNMTNNRSNARVFLLALISITLASTSFASAQIVAFGHSAAQGGRLPANETWPAVLEGMLRARGSQVHVINAGVNGETTDKGLARLDSAIPDGTKIVILTYNGYNDARTLIYGRAHAHANIEAMKSKIKARGIRLIDAMGIYGSLFRQPGLVMPDGAHLNAEGNKRLAATLARTL